MVKISTLFTSVAAATTFGAVTAAPLMQSNANVARQVVSNIQVEGESPFGSKSGPFITGWSAFPSKRDGESVKNPTEPPQGGDTSTGKNTGEVTPFPPKRDGESVPQKPNEPPKGGDTGTGKNTGEVTPFPPKRDGESVPQKPNEPPKGGDTGTGKNTGEVTPFPPKRDLESLTPEEMNVLAAMLGDDEPVNVARQIPAKLPTVWAAPIPDIPFSIFSDAFVTRALAAEHANVARQEVVGNIQIPSETPFGSIPSKVGKFLGGLLFGKRDVESLTAEEMLILSAVLGDKPVNVARQEVVGNIQIPSETPFGSIPSKVGKFLGGLLFGKRDVESLTPEEMLILSAMFGQN